MKVHAIRLKPDEDLKKSLMNWAQEHQVAAACILTCVGSLKKISLRLADEKQAFQHVEKFEIVSLVGTFSHSGAHFHISVSDREGKCIGGHLLEENIIYTTAEIVVLEISNLEFLRQQDVQTGYLELVIKTSGESN